jgi:hypothetical protein
MYARKLNWNLDGEYMTFVWVMFNHLSRTDFLTVYQ